MIERPETLRNEVRGYLLGSLSEEQRTELETRYFADESLFEQIEGFKEDLIDEYLLGKLSRSETKAFEARFAVSGGR